MKQLRDLTYFNAYLACFSASYHNSSMWGHYAGGHTGVCLKFKVTQSDKEDPYITLNSVKHKIYQVQYTKQWLNINFFDFLGRISEGALDKFWNINSNEACRGNHLIMQSDRERWFENYWKNFYEIHRMKSPDWAYEQECRVIKTDFNSNHIGLKDFYEFNCLEGIIFGINTSNEHKSKISKIILEKLKKSQGQKFSFHQAYFCSKSHQVKSRLLLSVPLEN